MPQLDLMTLTTQVFWLLVFVVVLYSIFVHKEGVLHRVSKVLKLRRKVRGK